MAVLYHDSIVTRQWGCDVITSVSISSSSEQRRRLPQHPAASSLMGHTRESQVAPILRAADDAYFSGEKFAGTRILLYWLTIIACALGRNA